MKKAFFLSLLTLLAMSLFFNISFAFGSFRFFFSGINFIAPLLSICMSNFFGFLLVPILWIFKFSHQITLGLPTLVASFCWLIYDRSKNSNAFLRPLIMLSDFLLRFLLPVFAILIFASHPVAGRAYLYSFYWFIPIVIYLLQKRGWLHSPFYFALSVSFVSHALGSIIWLYAISMGAGEWMALIPIVFLERIVFATGSCIIYRSLLLLKERFFDVRCFSYVFGVKRKRDYNYAALSYNSGR